MHQLGLLRALRAAVIFAAAVIVAAQVLSFIRASETRAAVIDPSVALPSSLAAIGFDGAAPLVPVAETPVLH